jgi:hypothetical protein
MGHIGFTVHAVWNRLLWTVVLKFSVVESKENVILNEKLRSVCVCYNSTCGNSFVSI